MITFIQPEDFVSDIHYEEDRKKTLSGLNLKDLDEPVIDIVEKFNNLPFSFTLQCCWGHFLYGSQRDPQNLDSLPGYDPGWITYRIAYIAFSIKEILYGINFYNALEKLQGIDREYIQFGSAGWFWKRRRNSFVLQVEPEKHKYKDQVRVIWQEALHIEKTRQRFFEELRLLLSEENYKLNEYKIF